MVIREKFGLRPSETTSESMLNARRENTWQMRIRTPGSLFTRIESVCVAPRGAVAFTGVSVVMMVWDIREKFSVTSVQFSGKTASVPVPIARYSPENRALETGNFVHVEPMGFSIL